MSRQRLHGDAGECDLRTLISVAVHTLHTSTRRCQRLGKIRVPGILRIADWYCEDTRGFGERRMTFKDQLPSLFASQSNRSRDAFSQLESSLGGAGGRVYVTLNN